MLRAGINDPNNLKIIAGLSEQNIIRLKNDQPINVPIRSFGINISGDLIIMYGQTEESIAKKLKKVGILGQISTPNLDPKLVSQSALIDQYSKILIATVGLPRSGKSTWAKTQAWPIVNPDAVRLSLHGHRFIAEAEPFVWASVKLMINSLFLAGHNIVILDACNNTRKRRDELKDSKYQVFFKHIDTSAETCFERAITENDEAIIKVIERMNLQHQPLEEDERMWP